MKNNRIYSILLSAGLALGWWSAAQAAGYSFSFNPDDLLNLYPASAAGDKTSQDNARKFIRTGRTLMTWETSFGQAGKVYDTPSFNGVVQPDAYNTYRNWLDGLGPNEGLYDFNFVIAYSGTTEPSRTAARSWGPHLVATPTSQVFATASAGWTVNTTSPFAEYVGADWTLSSINPVDFVRPGGSHPAFTFTVTDLLWDIDNDGIGDRPPQAGDFARVFFGSDGMIFDANGWGNRPGYASFNSSGNPIWEGVLMFEVPEPSSIGLLGFFLVALVGRRVVRR